MEDYRDEELCIVIAGSQGQPGSSLVRAVAGEHPLISVGKADKVVFSTEPLLAMRVTYTTRLMSWREMESIQHTLTLTKACTFGHAGRIEQQPAPLLNAVCVANWWNRSPSRAVLARCRKSWI